MTESPVKHPTFVFMLAFSSIALFGAMNVCVKLASAYHSVVEIMFFRSLLALLPVFTLLVMLPDGFKLLKTKRPMAHMARGGVGVLGMCLYFWSFSIMPLADATVLHFAMPLVLTLLSIPFLGEKVGKYRMGAVVVGFVGVIIAMNPSTAMPVLGTIVSLSAATTSAVAMILVRRMGNSEHALTIVFYFLLTGTVVSGLLLPFYWTAPSLESLAYLLLIGLTGGMAQIFQTRAYAMAPASFVSPFNYLSILFAAFFGWAIFGDVPASSLWIGAGIVCASGLFILYRETILKVAVAKENPYSIQPAEQTPLDVAEPVNVASIPETVQHMLDDTQRP